MREFFHGWRRKAVRRQPRSMFHEMLLIGYRLSAIAFAASFAGLCIAWHDDDKVMVVTAALAQSMVGLIVFYATLQMYIERHKNNPDQPTCFAAERSQ